MKTRVLLGMSGGMDSSVSAIILQESGFEVIGITFLFSGEGENESLVSKEAKLLAQKLGIEHHTIDLRKEFEITVVHYFISEYKNGKTPFPCAYCNPKLKFFYLEKYAELFKCKFISTGHYVRKGNFQHKQFLFKGKDPDKDQSFFLWGLNSKLIQKLIFPLGERFKSSVKEFARERGFVSLSNKKESMGICFIDNNNYRKFLDSKGVKTTKGNFVNSKGEILGEHEGITNYTIGQRRGLGINLNFPVFVAEIRVEANEIVLTEYKDLFKNKIVINSYQFAEIQEINKDKEFIVKVRYRLQETPCRIHILNETVAEVELLKPEAMIANGQTAVFYDKDRLVGGGFIISSE